MTKVRCEYTELVEIHKLQPNPKNPNKHPEKQIKRLAEIIDYQGMRSPIIVSKRSGFITKGHGRLEALKQLGWETAPVEFQDYDSEAQEFADMTADNEIARWATTDLSMVNAEMLDFGPDFNVDMLGFEHFSIEPIEKFDPQCDEDAVPEVDTSITKRGDIWLLGNHRVMCGDSTMIDDVEKLMNGEKADMVFTDPPYKLTSGGDTNPNPIFKKTMPGYKNDGKLFNTPEFEEWIKNLRPCLSASADIYTMCNDKNLMKLLVALDEEKFKLHNVLVMKKDTHTPNRWYLKNCEFTIYSYIGEAKKINNVGSFAAQDVKMPKGKVHQSQKPVEYIEGIILNSSKKSVFEPFLGSGSTLIACEKTNRKCYGMELDEHYCDVIVERWQNFTGKEAVLESNGKSFNELKPHGIKG